MTNVVVLPDRDSDESKGLNRISDLEAGNVRTWKAVPLEAALTKRYSTYAHVLLYTFPDETRWPRINKAALPEIREEWAPSQPLVWGTALDYDNVNHEPLDVAGYRSLLERIEDAPLSYLPTYTWKTRSGARLLFVHDLVSPERAEALHEFLRHHYEAAGIPCDPGVWEWNRPHALPWVVRDGAPLDPDQVLEREPLGVLPDVQERQAPLRLNLRTLHRTLKDPEGLVWKNGQPTDKLTAWGAWAKGRMVGRDALAAWEVPSLEPSTRNPTLFKWAASLVSMTYGLQDTTPEHVYEVLHPTVEANLRAGLDREVWRAVCYCWAREEAQHKQNEVARVGFLDNLRAQVAKWGVTHPSGEDDFLEWIQERLFLTLDGCYYSLRENGLYALQPVKYVNLVASLRTSGMVGGDRVLPSLSTLNDKGKATPLRCQDVVDRYSTPISEILFKGGNTLGGTLVGDGKLLLTTFARRPDLIPERSEWVHGWLSSWFGEYLPLVEEWLSGALDFEGGPIAALSLQSVGGSGKNLLMVALARTITSLCYSQAQEVFGSFQPKLGKTPFVHVDETWPNPRGVHAFFRSLIGTWTQTVNRKYMHESDMQVCPRVILSANRSNLVEVLFGDPNMTRAEHEATAERVIHLRLGSAGKTWLEENGSMAVASQKLESDEISRHLLWLYHTVPRHKKGRFLMVGDSKDPFLLSLADGNVATLGEALVLMFETDKINAITPVTASMVLHFMDNLMLTDRFRGFNLITLGRALRNSGFLKTDRTVNVARLCRFAKNAEMRHRKLVETVRRLKA